MNIITVLYTAQAVKALSANQNSSRGPLTISTMLDAFSAQSVAKLSKKETITTCWNTRLSSCVKLTMKQLKEKVINCF